MPDPFLFETCLGLNHYRLIDLDEIKSRQVSGIVMNIKAQLRLRLRTKDLTLIHGNSTTLYCQLSKKF